MNRAAKLVEINGVMYVTAADHRAKLAEMALHSHEGAQLFAEAMVMLRAARKELREFKGDS